LSLALVFRLGSFLRRSRSFDDPDANICGLDEAAYSVLRRKETCSEAEAGLPKALRGLSSALSRGLVTREPGGAMIAILSQWKVAIGLKYKANYLSHLRRIRQGCPRDLWAFPALHPPQYSTAVLLPISMHSLRLCIVLQRDRCQGCREV
jgi:hypothetical protein